MANSSGAKPVRITIHVPHLMGIAGYASNSFHCEIKWRRVKPVKKKFKSKVKEILAQIE